jgi:4-hydroxybenzoate polyprenyltransferase
MTAVIIYFLYPLALAAGFAAVTGQLIWLPAFYLMSLLAICWMMSMMSAASDNSKDTDSLHK